MARGRIFSIPAKGMGHQNPFPALLAEHLESESWIVDGGFKPAAFLKTYRAAIVHWPEHASVQRSALVAWLRTAAIFLLLAWQKLRGAMIIRILHNVDAHKGARPILLGLNQKAIFGLTDTYIYLSATSRDAFLDRHPSQKAKRRIDLFHPRYGDELALTDTDRAPQLRYIGDIRPYKGLDRFLELLAATPEHAALDIIGRSEDRAFSDVIAKAVDQAKGRGLAVSWDDRRPEHDELTSLLQATRLLVMPYRKSWNSGIAIKALENGAALVCSDQAIFRELQAAVGAPWVWIYEDNAESLAAVVAEAMRSPPSDADRERLATHIGSLSWPRFASAISDVLKR